MRSHGKINISYFTAFSFFMLGCLVLPAQEIHLSLSRDTIGFNETATLTLSGETNSDIAAIQDPKVEGVAIIGSYDNTDIDLNSGKVKLKRTYTLAPYKTGKFSLGPACVQIGSHRTYSNKLSLVIVSYRQSDVELPPVSESHGSKDVFLRCETDKKKVVLGEQILVSLNLYRRVRIMPNPTENPVPDPFIGFYYYEGQITPKLSDSIVNVNGLPYHLTTIYEEFVFPNRVGKLSIPAYKYVCSKMVNPFPSGNPLIDEINETPVDTLLITSPVPIEVSEIPDKNKPLDFQGDVGEFSLNSSIDHDHVKANEPVILNVSITGKGNIDFIRFPVTKFPDGIESFPPSSSDTITQTWDGITGEKKFRVTLIPKSAGNFTIPGISFSYYDAGKKDFVTLKTPEFALKVDAADSSKDVTENNLPESFLETKSYGKIIRRILFIILPPALLILALFFISRKKKKKKENEDALLKKTEKENENGEHFVATKKSSNIQGMINAAENLIIAGKTKAGIAQLYETLYTALCEKTELTREEASYHQMRFRLEIKNYPREFAAEILSLLQELSELRYTDAPINAVKLAENIQNTRKLTLKLA